MQALADMPRVYPGMVANLIRQALNAVAPATQRPVDQHQSNALFGVHQLRVRLPDDPTVYRVLIAPADAPIFIGKVAADAHFLDALVAEAPDQGK